MICQRPLEVANLRDDRCFWLKPCVGPPVFGPGTWPAPALSRISSALIGPRLRSGLGPASTRLELIGGSL